MTLASALKEAKNTLSKTTIKNFAYEAEELLAFVLKTDRPYILAHPEIDLKKREARKYFNLINKRQRYYPFAYLTNEQYFYGLPFFVDKRVLVPRPETEIMVDEILNIIKQNKEPITLIDLGTGSGCIPISVQKNINTKCDIIAIDKSRKALQVAKINNKKLKTNISFKRGNLLEPLKNLNEGLVIMSANLPYLDSTCSYNQELHYEPKIALNGGPDGLALYRSLAKQLERFSNKKIILLVEGFGSQFSLLKNIFSKAKKIEIKKDLSGQDRIAIFYFNN
jgi:release factor glutamine methyltransferase